MPKFIYKPLIACVFSLSLFLVGARNSLLSPLITSARFQEQKPITKRNLLSSLELGKRQKTKAKVFIDLITQHLVEFKLTNEDEKSIRELGAYLGESEIEELIAAIYHSYAYGVALTSTRLILTAKTNNSLLEIIIVNRSKQAFQLQNIIISGTSRVACARYSPAPPPQRVSLNWSQIISKSPNDDVGSWTELAGEKVKVTVKYQKPGCDGTQGSLIINIPTLAEIAPQTTNRVLMKITEETALFNSEEYERDLTYLRNWGRLEVSITPSRDIYPQSIRISAQ